MVKFEVKNMNCGHCAGSITKAIKEVDPQAEVNIDLANKMVNVNGNASAEEIGKAIEEAGFTPTLS